MDAIPDLKIGSRVLVNIPHWRAKPRLATVIGTSTKSRDCVRVLYDGLRNAVTVYRRFCSIVKDELIQGEKNE